MTDFSERLQLVSDRIQAAAAKYDRDPNQIHLLAVSKTKPVNAILAAYEAGQRHFGENYLQDALTKIENIKLPDIEWHFIGRVQSNKTRQIAENFSWVHGIDSIKHARRLSEQRPKNLPPLNICIQVNLSQEESKGGVQTNEVAAMAREITDFPGITLRGLMTLPAPEQDFEKQREPFRQLRELLETLNDQGLGLDTLSIGMSNDLEAAIAEGATIVRIGTALFGAR